MVIQPFTANLPSDAFLVMLFMAGYLVFSALIMVKIRKRYFPTLPSTLILPGIFIAGLMNPAIWLITRPAVYEAAISGGQCCLSAGIYFLLTAFDRKPGAWIKLVFSGTSLSFAVLSRYDLAVGVVWIFGMATWALIKTRGFRKGSRLLMAFGLPLLLGMSIVSGYNYLRFGSPLEVGLKYQLAGINQNKNIEFMFSPSNILPNLNVYLFYPTQKLDKFPYTYSPWVQTWSDSMFIPGSQKGTPFFMIEPVAGVLDTSPILWLCLIPVMIQFGRMGSGKRGQKRSIGLNEPGEPEPGLNWLFCLYLGLVITGFLPVSLFFTSTMRYIFDFSPSLLMLAFASFLYAYHSWGRRLFRIMLLVFAFVLLLVSLKYSLQLGFTSYGSLFANHNMALYKFLAHFP